MLGRSAVSCVLKTFMLVTLLYGAKCTYATILLLYTIHIVDDSGAVASENKYLLK